MNQENAWPFCWPCFVTFFFLPVMDDQVNLGQPFVGPVIVKIILLSVIYDQANLDQPFGSVFCYIILWPVDQANFWPFCWIQFCNNVCL